MSHKLTRQVSLALALFFTMQVAAFADALEGRVAKASSHAVDITVYDAQGRPYPNALHVKVDSYTQLNGVSTAADFRRNDPVGADVRQDESGAWRADHITLFQDVNARPATQSPSPSLRDVLGNPVVRGALTGAATGAIASAASGGKAGKGALVGAGVGAAAGLLGQMFSQPSKNASDRDDQ